MKISQEEKRFLQIVNDISLREFLLARLEKLGLLSAFLEVESETT